MRCVSSTGVSWPVCFLTVLFCVLGCDKYPRTNPFDPDYEGSDSPAALQVTSFELEERSPDRNNRHFEVNISVLNSGSGAAPDVIASLSESDSELELEYVTELELGHLLSGQSATGTWPKLFGIRMPRSTNVPKTTSLRVLLESSDGSEWIDTLDVVFEAALLRTIRIDVERAGVSLGEIRFRLKPTIVNDGLGAGIGASATLETQTELVSISPSPPLQFGHLFKGDSAKPQFDVYWVAAIPEGTQVPYNAEFTVVLSVDDGSNWENTVQLVLE